MTAKATKAAKPRRLTHSQQLAKAYYEAGHAVAACYLRLPLGKRGVTIIPDDEQGTAGRVHVLFKKSNVGVVDNTSGRARLRTEKHAIASLAGIEAQQQYRLSSVRNYHAHADYIKAMSALEHFAFDYQELEAWIGLLSIRARNLVALCWPQIEAVSEALMQRNRLSVAQVQRIFNKPSREPG